MTRTRFTKKLVEIRMAVVTMHELVEQALKSLIPVLQNGLLDEAERIKAGDVEINKLEGKIFDLCASAIVTEQPVAQDLRRVISSLKIVADLERIGDYAANIAKQLLSYPHSVRVIKEVDFLPMIEQGVAQLSSAISSYVNDDTGEARLVAAEDRKMDKLFDEVMERVANELAGQSEPARESWLQIAIIGRYLERLGDHVTNICEWTVYSVEGELVEL
ncbi:MAG: phosphate signaling complex protein PhoU [Spirochaetaceae bacterium]|nr:phosphate signaling complex protein PhoU [Spirochaetaceae bacterium]